MNKRNPLSAGSIMHSSAKFEKEYYIDDVIGNGANCIVYNGHYIDSFGKSHKIRIKECYPHSSDIERKNDSLVWMDKNVEECDKTRFKESYEKIISAQNDDLIANETVHNFDCVVANNTLYSIMDSCNATTFDKCAKCSLQRILKIVRLLAITVGKYHKSGFLHLDIKPDNFMVYPPPSEHIVLFDLDTVTSIKEIRDESIKALSYSSGWSAPEQIQGKYKKIGVHTDIFSIGAVLFYKIMGRNVSNEDMSVLAEWNFDNEYFDIRRTNPKVKRLLTNIFRKTLSVNIKRRYDDIDELVFDLDKAISAIEFGKPHLCSELPSSSGEFVGRENELNGINDAFANGAKAVFLMGMGGIGKTEIARWYGIKYAKKYDAIIFKHYDGSLEELVEDIDIQNCEDNPREHRKNLQKLMDEHVLLIVDNFDTDNDRYIEKLFSFNCKILFTTRCQAWKEMYNTEQYTYIDIYELNRAEQMNLFLQNYNLSVSADEKTVVNEILECISGLTLLIPIVAKQLNKGLNTLSEILDKIKAAGVRGASRGKVYINKDGVTYSGTMYEIMKEIFFNPDINEEKAIVLSSLCVLKGISVKRKKFEEWIGDGYSEDIDDLINSGVVISDQKSFLRMHRIVIEIYQKELSILPSALTWITDKFESWNMEILLDKNNRRILTKRINLVIRIVKNCEIDFEFAKSIVNLLHRVYRSIPYKAARYDYGKFIPIVESFVESPYVERLSDKERAHVYVLLNQMYWADFCLDKDERPVPSESLLEYYKKHIGSMINYSSQALHIYGKVSDKEFEEIVDLLAGDIIISLIRSEVSPFVYLLQYRSFDEVDNVVLEGCETIKKLHIKWLSAIILKASLKVKNELLLYEDKGKPRILTAFFLPVNSQMHSNDSPFWNRAPQEFENDKYEEFYTSFHYDFTGYYMPEVSLNSFEMHINKLVEMEHYYDHQLEMEEASITPIFETGRKIMRNIDYEGIMDYYDWDDYNETYGFDGEDCEYKDRANYSNLEDEDDYYYEDEINLDIDDDGDCIFEEECYEFSIVKLKHLAFNMFKMGLNPFEIIDNSDTLLLEKGKIAKDAFLKMCSDFDEYDSEILAFCSLISLIFNSPKEAECFIDKYLNNSYESIKDNKVLAKNFMNHDNVEFAERFIYKCINKLKVEKETLENIQLIRNYAEFIDNAELAAEYARKEEEILGEIEGFKFE